MTYYSNTYLAMVKKPSFAPVQKLLPWMAVWMYACFATNLRHFSRQNKQQSTQQKTQRATRLLVQGKGMVGMM